MYFNGILFLGRHYDKTGRYYSDGEQGLWTDQYYHLYYSTSSLFILYYRIILIKRTVEAFKNKSKCMVDEYSSYNVTEINRNVILEYNSFDLIFTYIY